MCPESSTSLARAGFFADGIGPGSSPTVTAKVECYSREDPADPGARYILCITQFA